MTGQNGRPPTLESVARVAGVSRATVSRVVNLSPLVTPEIREVVQAAIEQLGYVPNRAARSLAANRSLAIALVVPEDTGRFFAEPYFAAIVKGITDVIAASDYVLILQISSTFGGDSKPLRYLRGGNVDGALVVSHSTDDYDLLALADVIPVVFGGRPLMDPGGTSYFVDVDNVSGAADATGYLIGLGRSHIAAICGPDDMPAGRDRTIGWRRALDQAGLSVGPSAEGDYTEEGGRMAMEDILDADPSIDAVFAANDLMARGAIDIIRESGRLVPEDIAVVGFDDAPMVTENDIGLTTIHQPIEETGAAMARMLLALLAGETVEHELILPAHIFVRESA